MWVETKCAQQLKSSKHQQKIRGPNRASAKWSDYVMSAEQLPTPADAAVAVVADEDNADLVVMMSGDV